MPDADARRRAAPGVLVAANERAHAAQLEAYDDFLEALTRLDFLAVMRALDRFRTLLRDHLALEEGEVMPLARSLSAELAGELERIDGDHRILVRSLAAACDALGEIRRAPAPRRALVRRLGVVQRPREVLEHHGLRETARLYPLLDDELGPATALALARRIDHPPTARR